MTIRSAITKELQHGALMRGSFLAGVGAILLLYTGGFMEPRLLGNWGAISFLIGFGLITWGLLPYRQLMNLQMNPYEIIVEDNHFVFQRRGKPMFSVPYGAIERSGFIEDRWHYGIAIWIKSEVDSPVIIHSPNVDINRLRTQNQKKHGCDLFLPYFTKRAYEEFTA
jgi:hypothetical protein